MANFRLFWFYLFFLEFTLRLRLSPVVCSLTAGIVGPQQKLSKEQVCHSSCCNHSSGVNQPLSNLLACEICGSASLLWLGLLRPEAVTVVSHAYTRTSGLTRLSAPLSTGDQCEV